MTGFATFAAFAILCSLGSWAISSSPPMNELSAIALMASVALLAAALLGATLRGHAPHTKGTASRIVLATVLGLALLPTAIFALGFLMLAAPVAVLMLPLIIPIPRSKRPPEPGGLGISHPKPAHGGA